MVNLEEWQTFLDKVLPLVADRVGKTYLDDSAIPYEAERLDRFPVVLVVYFDGADYENLDFSKSECTVVVAKGEDQCLQYARGEISFLEFEAVITRNKEAALALQSTFTRKAGLGKSQPKADGITGGQRMKIPKDVSDDTAKIITTAERATKTTVEIITGAAVLLDSFAVDYEKAAAYLANLRNTPDGREELAAMRTGFAATKELLGSHIALLDKALDLLGPADDPAPDQILRAVR